MPSGRVGGLTFGQSRFSQIPRAEIQRSVFNRSCGLKTTFNAGYLVPIFVDEVLPGDTLNMRLAHFGRLATLLHPVMENIYLDFFFFFVPNRLVWNNWERFNGAQDNPDDSVDFEVPISAAPGTFGYTELSLQDYFGLPTQVVNIEHNNLPLRAYNLIYNEWFRDQNLQDSVVVDKDDGPDLYSDYVLLRRGKRHDYFTSCLPFPQKGTAVELPLGSTAPVVGTGGDLKIIGAATGVYTSVEYATATAGRFIPETTTNWAVGENVQIPTAAEGASGMVADLSSATAATINQIREAFQIQRLFERDARGGTRYTEIIRSHFGVVSPDQRLQRPEFLGGGTSRVNVNPVAATASTTSVGMTPGRLQAFGTFSGNNVGFSRSFTEHGYVIGLVSMRADLNYQEGLERMWSRSTRFDFYWPALAHLGEQAVLKKELVAFGPGFADDEVFGYQERYAEYRYKPSRVTGRFRSNCTAPLDTWHLAQEFGAQVELDADFIVENPPIDRILAVTQTLEPQFILDAFFQYRCVRPMPTYSVPGLIDHF